jgi:hypothetical protein
MSRLTLPACSSPFCVTLVLLFAALLAPHFAAAQQAAVSHQLTLIRPDDREFASLLAENFPRLEALQGYALYRPFLVLLRNDTPYAARAYSVQWLSRLSNGQAPSNRQSGRPAGS